TSAGRPPAANSPRTSSKPEVGQALGGWGGCLASRYKSGSETAGKRSHARWARRSAPAAARRSRQSDRGAATAASAASATSATFSTIFFTGPGSFMALLLRLLAEGRSALAAAPSARVPGCETGTTHESDIDR